MGAGVHEQQHSDRNSSNSRNSTQLRHSIRSKLVEYKALLLRQLQEQHDAALKIVDRTLEEEQTRRDEETKDEDTNEEENDGMDIEDETTGDFTSNATATKSDGIENANAAVSNGQTSAEAEREPQPNGISNSPVETARSAASLAESSLSVSGNEGGRMNESAKQHPIVSDDKVSKTEKYVSVDTAGSVTMAVDARMAKQSTPVVRRVLRTAVPSKKYLDPMRDQPKEYTAADVQPILISSTSSTPTHVPVAKSSQHQVRFHSLEQVHSDFEKTLSDVVTKHRSIGTRSLAMTRKRQLPRVSTPSRHKTHWDYLLEEMKWMAADFAQERNWKRVMSFHLASDVIVAQNADRVRREKESRQLARDIALQVSAFWRTIERVAARSRMRFEACMEEKDGDHPVQETNKKEEEQLDDVSISTVTIEVQFKEPDFPDAVVDHDKQKLQALRDRIRRMIETSKRAREVMECANRGQHAAKREEIFQSFHNRNTSCGRGSILAAFQVVALRWMLELVSSGYNIFLNDQLGMGKAATVAAFLSLIEHVDADGAPTPMKAAAPHLILVADDELHKWIYHLRDWHPKRKIQVYDGTAAQRKRLQREWKKRKIDMILHEMDDGFEDELSDVFCCVCPIQVYVEDREAFEAFTEWQFVVVEGDHDPLFDDPQCVSRLTQLVCRKRRILCHSQPPENWKSSALRYKWAEFLCGSLSSATEDGEGDGAWYTRWTKQAILEKSCASTMMKAFGKTISSSSFWKAQHDNMNGLLVCLMCLSLRRARSEVEAQLGKVEEQSVSCALSASQVIQYRNALSGFAASLNEREDRMDVWLALFLKLRSICNCVDLMNDVEKLAHADIAMMEAASGKLQALLTLLQRLISKEDRRVAVYCQQEALFPVLEMLLGLAQISYVRATGSISTQRRALRHFALQPVVKVALVPTRLGAASGHRAMPVYGADAIVVVDSDWSNLCDAKLRACWARASAAREVPVFRLHCEQTIEAALLRAGSCLSEKIFGEMSPSELVVLPNDGMIPAFEKPTWWSAGGGNSAREAKLMASCAAIEEKEKFCNFDIEGPLLLSSEIDAEEHVLLANTDELTPVEWYAVSFVHTTIDKKKHEAEASLPDDVVDLSDSGPSLDQSFDGSAIVESKKAWQEVDTSKLFYSKEQLVESDALELQVHKLLGHLRSTGMEVSYEISKPPVPPITKDYVDSEPGRVASNQTVYQVTYREPAPAPPPPPKIKSESLSAVPGEIKPIKLKKPRNAAGLLTGTPGKSGVALSAVGSTSGVKRKLDQLGGLKSNGPKEQRLDMEGIPIPDVAEFEDDDFWGDTNLDALDSASWDDASVLSGILGPSLDPTASASTSSSASTPATGGSTTQKSSSKKLKAGGTTGRSRKGSISDGSREGWTANDDLILRKLFELYGSNWTLIAQVFNASTAVSQFLCKKRSPRQCYDRYGKIISGSLNATATSTTKDGKTSGSTKPPKVPPPPTLTPEILSARIGLPADEMLLAFPVHNSLPGLPPPSIAPTPTLVELFVRHTKQQPNSTDSKAPDDLKSIRSSFDSIIQCMKRKIAPPPIPIPVVGDAASSATTATPATPGEPTPAAASATIPTVPPPHKSHVDMLSLLPSVALTPDEVIKRSKEAAAAAVQAAAAVASVGRDVSPLSATGDVILGGAFGSSIATSRKGPPPISLGSSSTASGVTPRMSPVMSSSSLPVTSAWGETTPNLNRDSVNALNVSGVGAVPLGSTTTTSTGTAATRNPAMPVTTSTLLHVLDRMPEIKNKIQTILNRNDCSEAQKVAMIARLLSNTNAINATAVAAAAANANHAPVQVPAIPASRTSTMGTSMAVPVSTTPLSPGLLVSPPASTALPPTPATQATASTSATVSPPNVPSAPAAAVDAAAVTPMASPSTESKSPETTTEAIASAQPSSTNADG